jgi:hypothetical protein
VSDRWSEMIADAVERSDRPLHPTLQPFLHVADPTARASVRGDGSEITARERTAFSTIGFHTMESFYGTLTPLAMGLMAFAMLQFLSMDGAGLELEVALDPWGEIGELPDKARDEFQRAYWHVNQALDALGLKEEE